MFCNLILIVGHIFELVWQNVYLTLKLRCLLRYIAYTNTFLPSSFCIATDTGVAGNFDCEGPKLEKNLWRYFGDVFRWRDDVM